MTVKMKRSKDNAKICKAILIAYPRTARTLNHCLDICHCSASRPVVQAVRFVMRCEDPFRFSRAIQATRSPKASKRPKTTLFRSRQPVPMTPPALQTRFVEGSGMSMIVYAFLSKCHKSHSFSVAIARRLQCWHPASPSWSTLATSPSTCRSTVVTQSCSCPLPEHPHMAEVAEVLPRGKRKLIQWSSRKNERIALIAWLLQIAALSNFQLTKMQYRHGHTKRHALLREIPIAVVSILWTVINSEHHVEIDWKWPKTIEIYLKHF